MDRKGGKGGTGNVATADQTGRVIGFMNVKVHLRRLYIGLLSIISAARPPVRGGDDGSGGRFPSDWGDSDSVVMIPVPRRRGDSKSVMFCLSSCELAALLNHQTLAPQFRPQPCLSHGQRTTFGAGVGRLKHSLLIDTRQRGAPAGLMCDAWFVADSSRLTGS